MSEFHCFLDPDALIINQARQEHLASLDLDLDGKTVIEVGAGIGLHTDFFLKRGCEVTVTDGASVNVGEIKRRHPGLRSFVLDLEDERSLRDLGVFDIIYCYGLLYHMSNPDSVLRRLGEICQGQILLELICGLDTEDTVMYVDDPAGLNQSTVGRGCRPSRRWILNKLKEYFGYGYICATQPDHPDFPTDWTLATQYNTRAIFVGSKTTLRNSFLVTDPLQYQTKFMKGQ